MTGIDPYQAGMITKNLYYQKRDCKGTLCAVLDGTLEKRGLRLIGAPSRALLAGEIHELIVTDEPTAGPGSEVNHIAYWGFFEVTQATVVVVGDEIVVEGKCVGQIAGYDETHMPNHMNVVIKADQRVSGAELGLALGDKIHITMKKRGNHHVSSGKENL